MSNSDYIKRVAELDKLVIQHPAWANAKNGIQHNVLKSQFYRESAGCLLLANGGMGKTTVCRAILAQMPLSIKAEKRYEKTIIPAFYAEIPSPATVKSVAGSLLAKLNDPSPFSGTVAHMTARLILLLKECETKLVLLDEIQNLFDMQKTTTKVNTSVCNWIKALVNATHVTFCLIGLAEFAPILTMDTQLARRFPLKFELLPLHIGCDANPGPLPPFLAELKLQVLNRLQFSQVPHLDRCDTTLQIFAATAGNPAFIMALTKEAALNALQLRSRELTIDDFASAWETGITSTITLCKENPFRMAPGQLAGALRVGK